MSTEEFAAWRAKQTNNVKLTIQPTRTQVHHGPFQSYHKYKAQRTEVDGVKFASKSEAARYHYLKAEQAAGRLIFFLMQVRIDIPGGYYRLDFLEFWADGDMVWLDVKGFETEGFKIKRRAVEAIYPFKITTARERGREGKKTWEYA